MLRGSVHSLLSALTSHLSTGHTLALHVMWWHHRNPIRSTIQLGVHSLLRADFFKENKRLPPLPPPHICNVIESVVFRGGDGEASMCFRQNTVLLKKCQWCPKTITIKNFLLLQPLRMRSIVLRRKFIMSSLCRQNCMNAFKKKIIKKNQCSPYACCFKLSPLLFHSIPAAL